MQFAVVFAPVAASGQGRTATLALTHNDQEWAEAVTGAMVHEIALSGEVTAFGGGPRLVAQPATDVLSYGALAQGYRLVRRMTVSNTGTAALTGIVEVAGETAADEGNWQLEQGGNIVADGTALDLAPGESQMLDVVFAPQAIGETAATFRYVHSDSQYPGGTSLEVALSGEGVATQDGRHLTLAPEYGGLSFGSAAAGDTLVQTLTVSNALAASEALSVWLDLSDQVNYAVEVNGTEITYNQLVYGGDPGAPHLVLVPGASAEVRVLYKPQAPGEHVSSVHLRHDDGDYHPEEVLVTVWGVGTDGARKRYYYLSDHLGSVRATVNETGEVVHYDDYYPFGLQMPGRSYVTPDAPRERFTGHELDEETDLYYAGARYLDPVMGRWLATDPLEEYSSPYIYVGGNPIALVDPTGMSSDLPYCSGGQTTGCVNFIQESLGMLGMGNGSGVAGSANSGDPATIDTCVGITCALKSAANVGASAGTAASGTLGGYASKLRGISDQFATLAAAAPRYRWGVMVNGTHTWRIMLKNQAGVRLRSMAAHYGAVSDDLFSLSRGVGRWTLGVGTVVTAHTALGNISQGRLGEANADVLTFATGIAVTSATFKPLTAASAPICTPLFAVACGGIASTALGISAQVGLHKPFVAGTNAMIMGGVQAQQSTNSFLTEMFSWMLGWKQVLPRVAY